MRNKSLHIGQFLILIILISFFQACEKDIQDNLYKTESKIWVNALVGTNDTVRIYLGTTSGMNSGDIARYRDDAIINLYVNSSTSKELEYKSDPNYPSKGYYYYPRLSQAKPGDSLRFEAWINGTEFENIAGETYIPFPVEIDTLIHTSQVDPINNKLNIKLKIVLDSLSKLEDNKFFELKIKNNKYADINQKFPTEVESISNYNNLNFSYGQSWNEGLQAILINYNEVEKNILEVSFSIDDKSHKNLIEAELRTITKEYYQYSKALDNGSITKSNVINGSGIFAGFSSSVKTKKVK